ncbi:MAG: universal stress protein [Gammaproteobacteria bacterium]|jgi:nucleotide-binding universal stress UspA family protein|nr:universal stress protein [Gammaproteobacteria bacterium]NCF81597.1 universal stress protein [Pseudomonadota bacterium]
MINNILCALDGSNHAEKALDMAIALAQKFDSRLVLFHVLMRNLDAEEIRRFSEVEGWTKEAIAEVQRLQTVDSRIEVGDPYDAKHIPSDMLVKLAQHILKSARSDAEGKGVSNIATVIGDGDPAARILACAKKENIDCIIMGSRGLNDLQALFEGSVSRKVSNRAPCTTIAVR